MWAASFHVAYIFGPFCANTTSSIKPEVYKISQCCQSRTEPRPLQATRSETSVNFGHVVFEICERTGIQSVCQTYRHSWRTDGQMDGHAHHNNLLPYPTEVGVIENSFLLIGIYNFSASGLLTPSKRRCPGIPLGALPVSNGGAKCRWGRLK